MRKTRVSLALKLSLLVVAASSTWGHEEDFEVGIDPVTNRIKVHYDPELFPWELPPSNWPELAGFALDDPGFVSLDPNEVEPGVFELLNPLAVVALRVVSVSSPEMKVWDPVGPGEPGFQIFGDDLWTIGPAPFDKHPIWHIDTADPAYNPMHAPWYVTFQLSDLAGVHQPSDLITVSFTPEPGSLGLLALGLLSAARRRSRWGRPRPASDSTRPGATHRPASDQRCLRAVLPILILAALPALAQHDGDIGVGRSAAGQLKTKPFDPNGVPCFDPNLAVGTLTYYASSNSWRVDSPGFDANFEADPPHDYYQLAYGASIRLVAYADMPPAFRVKYQTQTILHAGDYISLGSYQLHRHVVYIVDCNDPGYDPLRTLWYGFFTLQDVGATGYGASLPFPVRLSVLSPDEYLVGDVNDDGVVDFNDISPFVAVLSYPPGATVRERCAADTNLDGLVTFDDINPFVALLTG